VETAAVETVARETGVGARGVLEGARGNEGGQERSYSRGADGARAQEASINF